MEEHYDYLIGEPVKVYKTKWGNPRKYDESAGMSGLVSSIQESEDEDIMGIETYERTIRVRLQNREVITIKEGDSIPLQKYVVKPINQ